jgi:hypothetical protein
MGRLTLLGASLLLVLLVPWPRVAHAAPNYQGTYASDCSKQKEESVTISAHAIVLRTHTGTRTLKLIDIPNYNGGRVTPLPGFVTLLVAEDASGREANIEVFESNGAMTIRVTGDPDMENSLPPPLRRKRVPRCNAKPDAPARTPRTH